MATRYNVYAASVESDADSSGEWVSASDHEDEVKELEQQIETMEEKAESLQEEIKALSDANDAQVGLIESFNERIEELERALLEIINS